MKKVKSVAFNVSDPQELAIYTHAAKHKYFSTYIKRLIMRDMEEGNKTDLSAFYQAAKFISEAEQERQKND
jgi:hypothetical protein